MIKYLYEVWPIVGNIVVVIVLLIVLHGHETIYCLCHGLSYSPISRCYNQYSYTLFVSWPELFSYILVL